MYFGRLCRVKEGKLEKVREWFATLSTARHDEAIATFAYEGVTREVFVLFKGLDGNYYVLGCNETEGGNPPRPGNQTVPINQEHAAMKKECLEPISERGEVLTDLKIN